MKGEKCKNKNKQKYSYEKEAPLSVFSFSFLFFFIISFWQHNIMATIFATMTALAMQTIPFDYMFFGWLARLLVNMTFAS